MPEKKTKPFENYFFASLLGSCLAIFTAVVWKMTLSLMEIDQGSMSYFVQSIVIDFISTIGIAVLLGAVFNWILGTQSFVRYAKEKIVSVLISKEYINELDLESKENMLRSVIKPTCELANTYSRIDDYFNMYVKRSMELFSTYEFRSGTNIVGVARIEEDKVVVEFTIEYRSYVVDKEHPNMEIGLDDEKSQVLSTEVSFPNGNRIVLETQELKKEECTSKILKNDDSTKKVFCVEIPLEHKNDKFIDVCRTVKEVGDDHWINFSFRSTKPTDKMSLSIVCEDELVVKDTICYGPSDKFHFKIEQDGKKVVVNCNAWMDPGFGVNVLIAK